MHISLDLAPFRFLVETNSPHLFSDLATLYPSSVLTNTPDQQFYDFALTYQKPWWYPKAPFSFRCGSHHFRQTDASQIVSTFEWGLNWTLSSFQNYYLCIHAAVLEKNNKAFILPAPPGSGKSTLCALLMLSGWRLLSDEHCLIDLQNGMIVPAVRPVAIKNRSFAVIKQWFNQASLQCIQTNTHKGTVGYLPASDISWQQHEKNCQPAFVILPTYSATQAATEFLPVAHCDMFLQLVKNSFNYQALGQVGFDTLSQLLAQSQCYQLRYQDTAAALAIMEQLANV